MSQLYPSRAVFATVCLLSVSLAVSKADPVPNPIAGYNADQIPADGTVNSQSNVSAWDDNTGNGNTANSPNSGAMPSLQNSDPIFNGHDYVYFGTPQSELLTANSLFSGSDPRSLAAVYGVSSGAVGDNRTTPIVGEDNNGTADVGSWFMLQTRGYGNVVAGDPYLAGFGADDGNGNNPTPGRLVFALATYANDLETIYWAYGDPTTHLTTSVMSNPMPQSLNTGASPLQFGYDGGEDSTGFLELGDVEVYDVALTAGQATSEIDNLEAQYGYGAVPEPSTWAMLLGGAALVGLVIRGRVFAGASR